MAASDASAVETAAALMRSFAERTGLEPERPERRYLWTDAFAVCNFLGLARATREQRYMDLALRLVERVHAVLGRHRPDDARTGWLSSLGERDGEAHPTRGGLRIGKPLPERGRGEPLDEHLEWERDGQYFHYLTKWMYALDQVANATREPRFNLWARELAEVAHARFSYTPRGAGCPRMVWKMSCDLSRALVPSMGQHDPLDGLITCLQLEASAARLGGAADGPSLARAAADFSAMLAGAELRTADPLGLGGLLSDAHRLAELVERGSSKHAQLLEDLLAAAQDGLRHYARLGELRQPASQRLAFRELGLAIGLASVGMDARLAACAPYAPLGAGIESFWLEPEHRSNTTWSEHRDINEVMLATSLVPEGYLRL
ncbi:MAG TPA: hypothetical protein VMR86_12065 [Myxococcota bacterium]|nr:hypothetical protein [Myxococcota bacterium]